MQARLLNVPKGGLDWDEWGFHHRASHDLIRQAIQKKTGIILPDYVIYPIDPSRPDNFLQNNAQMHIDMLAPVNGQGSNLQDVDISNENQLVAWIREHYQEHYITETALGVGS